MLESETLIYTEPVTSNKTFLFSQILFMYLCIDIYLDTQTQVALLCHIVAKFDDKKKLPYT